MFDLLRISNPTLVTCVEGKKYVALYACSYNVETKIGWYIAAEVNDKNEYRSGTPCFLIASKDSV